MKKLFCLDITGLDKTESEKELLKRQNGYSYIAAQVPDETSRKLEQLRKDNEKQIRKLNTSTAENLAKLFIIVDFYLIILLIANILGKEEMDTIIANICGVIALTLLTVITIVHKINKIGRVKKSDEFIRFELELEALSASSKAILEIPDSVEKVDIISYAYRMRKGREIRKTPGNGSRNISLSLFEKDDMLCLADHFQRFDFPKACFKEFRFYNKSYYITSWNKEENFKSKKYAKYKISDNYGLKVKNYYSLIFEDQGQQYELLIMPYDFEAYKRIFPDLPIVNDKYRKCL